MRYLARTVNRDKRELCAKQVAIVRACVGCGCECFFFLTPSISYYFTLFYGEEYNGIL